MQALALVAGIAGAGISIYLTVLHYASATPACPAGTLVNCEQVLSSSYAVIGGTTVPTSAAGIAWFGVSAALSAVVLARRSYRSLQLAWAAAGLLTVLYLVFIEIVQLGVVCLWCTAAHLLVLFIFVVALTGVRAEA